VGFVPGEQVSGQILSDAVNLPAQTANGQGVVVFQWTAPVGFQPGTHQIVMTAPSGTVTQTFTVSGTATTNTANGGSGASVSTGGTADHSALISIAVLLLAAATVAGVLRRRTVTNAK